LMGVRSPMSNRTG